MVNNQTLKKGDKIVDFGQICRIFKIEKKKGEEGKKKQVIYFRHYFKDDQNKDAVYSIPLQNIKKANIRKPISRGKLKKLVEKLSQAPQTDHPVSAARAKDKLNKNDIYQTVSILKRLWVDKIDESVSFTKAKKDLFELAVKRLVEEVAYVGSVSLNDARKKIRESLKKIEINHYQDDAH